MQPQSSFDTPLDLWQVGPSIYGNSGKWYSRSMLQAEKESVCITSSWSKQTTTQIHPTNQAWFSMYVQLFSSPLAFPLTYAGQTKFGPTLCRIFPDTDKFWAGMGCTKTNPKYDIVTRTHSTCVLCTLAFTSPNRILHVPQKSWRVPICFLDPFVFTKHTSIDISTFHPLVYNKLVALVTKLYRLEQFWPFDLTEKSNGLCYYWSTLFEPSSFLFKMVQNTSVWIMVYKNDPLGLHRMKVCEASGSEWAYRDYRHSNILFKYWRGFQFPLPNLMRLWIPKKREWWSDDQQR